MKRFNYLARDERARGLARMSATLAIDNRIRAPLAVLAVVLVVMLGASTAQLARLHAARGVFAAASVRLEADAAPLAAIAATRTRLAAKQRLAQTVGDMQRLSIAHADDVAWIGNNLPRDTWLRSLRYESGGYLLEGTSDRATAVGEAILALHAGERLSVPRLVSLHDGDAGGAHINYTLRLEDQR